jgi:hypothetical protein
VVFADGESSQVLTINVMTDSVPEANEDFSVVLAPLPDAGEPTLLDPSAAKLELIANDASLVEIDGLAFDPHGNLFGALEADDPSVGGVVYIDKHTGAVATLVTGIARADQIAFNPVTGNFFVTSESQPESTQDRIYDVSITYDANHISISAVAQSLTTALPVNNLEGLVVLETTSAFGSIGDVCVAEDIANGDIVHVDPGTGGGSTHGDLFVSEQAAQSVYKISFDTGLSAAGTIVNDDSTTTVLLSEDFADGDFAG